MSCEHEDTDSFDFSFAFPEIFRTALAELSGAELEIYDNDDSLLGPVETYKTISDVSMEDLKIELEKQGYIVATKEVTTSIRVPYVHTAHVVWIINVINGHSWSITACPPNHIG